MQRCSAGPLDQSSIEDVRPAFAHLLTRVGAGIYPVRDGSVAFDEFTAIYPVGTFNQYISYRGRDIPEYPTPGRRALTTHQRTLTIDHVPTDDFYSYFPWLPYMHVGPRLHNAVHTLYWKMKPAETTFLPPAWRTVSRDSRDGEPFEYLWLLSRGPMSHGCTHLNAGHISELQPDTAGGRRAARHVDRSSTARIARDVFDTSTATGSRGMGVRYSSPTRSRTASRTTCACVTSARVLATPLRRRAHATPQTGASSTHIMDAPPSIAAPPDGIEYEPHPAAGSRLRSREDSVLSQRSTFRSPEAAQGRPAPPLSRLDNTLVSTR